MLDQNHCVLCGAESDVALESLHELETPIRELEELSAGRSSTMPMVDSEIVLLERQLLVDERKLLDLRRTREEFEARVDVEQGLSQSLESVYRFIGSTEQALKILGDIEGDDGLEVKVATLRSQIEDIQSQLDEKGRIAREQTVRDAIASFILRFVSSLQISGANGTPILDERELNLKFVRDGANKPDFLWQIGSGENWMAYHLATLFALHGVFLKRSNNPVPSFLIIDQPSQVYFPSNTFEKVVDGKLDESSSLRPGTRRHLDDLESTRQIFRSLARVQQAFEGKLQVVVLDHADQNAWGDQQNVALVENWRGSADFLIPSAWLPSRKPQ